jgi:hypothetical protein
MVLAFVRVVSVKIGKTAAAMAFAKDIAAAEYFVAGSFFDSMWQTV